MCGAQCRVVHWFIMIKLIILLGPCSFLSLGTLPAKIRHPRPLQGGEGTSRTTAYYGLAVRHQFGSITSRNSKQYLLNFFRKAVTGSHSSPHIRSKLMGELYTLVVKYEGEQH